MYVLCSQKHQVHTFFKIINQSSVPRTANPPLKIVSGIKSQSVIFRSCWTWSQNPFYNVWDRSQNAKKTDYLHMIKQPRSTSCLLLLLLRCQEAWCTWHSVHWLKDFQFYIYGGKDSSSIYLNCQVEKNFYSNARYKVYTVFETH